jgi:hypothetical protein
MAKPKLSKQELQLREENEGDSWLWASIQEKKFEEVDWATCLHVSRKRMKRFLYEWASKVANEFWVTHYRHYHGEGVPKEFGEYGVRVVERGWTVYIRWYRQSIKGKKDSHVITSVGLKSPEKGRLRMNMNQFTKAKDWELEAIKKAEDEFAKIRRCAEHLETIRVAVSGFKQLVGRADSLDEQDLEVTEVE